MARPQVHGIIQARMGSTRLPGKVLLPDGGGGTMLGFQLRRLERVASVDRWTVAVPDTDADTAILDAVPDHLPVHRGSEEDVLGRFLGAAGDDAPDDTIIVRICSDNPFIDPELVSDVVRAHLQDPGTDYVSYAYADGTPVILSASGLHGESVRLGALRQAARECEDLAIRQHVTNWVYTHSDRYSVRTIPLPEALDNKRLHFTVDTREDYEFFISVVDREGVSNAQALTAFDLVARYVTPARTE